MVERREAPQEVRHLPHFGQLGLNEVFVEAVQCRLDGLKRKESGEGWKLRNREGEREREKEDKREVRIMKEK